MFDRTVSSACDQLSCFVFHRHPVELIPEQIKSVGTNGNFFSLETDVPEPAHPLHTKDEEDARQFVANEVQQSISSDVFWHSRFTTRKDSRSLIRAVLQW